MEEKTRRSFLRTASVASFGALTAVGGASADSGPSVGKTIERLLTEGKFSVAEEVAQAHGGQLDTSRRPLSVENDEVSTDNFWKDPKNGQSELWVSISSGSWFAGDYRARAGWTLYEDDIVFEGYNTCPPDASALFWNGDYFVPESSGSSNFHSSDSEVSFGGVESYNGILANVDDPLPARDGSENTWSASFATDLNVVQSGAASYPIVMEYQHTYIDAAYKICGSLDVSFSLGGGTIEMNGDPQGWNNAAQNTI